MITFDTAKSFNLDPESWRLAHSGLIIPRKTRPVAIDLFAGAGGMSIGLLQAGWEVIAALEWDADAAITYMYNLGSYPINIHFGTSQDEKRLNMALEQIMKAENGEITNAVVSGGSLFSRNNGYPPVRNLFFGDIRKFTGKQILEAIGMERGEVDAVVGGPPCQGFSRAGKQNIMDPRNSLVFEFAKMVLEIYPKTMVMENVPNIVNMVTPEGLPVVDALCRILEDGNFNGVDTLKRSLSISAGIGAAMRNQDHAKKKTPIQVDKKQGQLQLL